MDTNKLTFLTNDFIFHLKHLAPDAKGKWGVMNGHEMIEHFTDAVRNANGKLHLPEVYSVELQEKSREFLMSDKPFRENTKNPLLGDTPPPVRHDTMQASIAELQNELGYLVELFEKDPAVTTYNPIFGELNYEGVIRLLYKHAKHHLKQFGLEK